MKLGIKNSNIKGGERDENRETDIESHRIPGIFLSNKKISSSLTDGHFKYPQ